MPDGFAALPPLNALRTFEVAARHLNFRLAAEELGVTQAAVAQQVRGLEASLHCLLFERRARGLQLTAAGHGYAAQVRSALAIIHEATSTLRPGPTRLTISVTPSFAAKWLIARLGDFTERHGQIDLRVLASEQLASFHADGVDLAVRYGRPPFGPGLNTQLLMEPPLVAVASPALFVGKAAPENFEQLADFLLLHDAHDLWPAFIGALFQQPVRPTPKNRRFNQTALAIDAALAGQGIALASRVFVEDELQRGRLVQVFNQQVMLDKGFYLAWPRKLQAASQLSLVKEWLIRQAQAAR